MVNPFLASIYTMQVC